MGKVHRKDYFMRNNRQRSLAKRRREQQLVQQQKQASVEREDLLGPEYLKKTIDKKDKPLGKLLKWKLLRYFRFFDV
ncbi:16707_t:CDS:2 [Funneliformis geosporum]|uniref:9900_t:CDS:1 n=1 Tax=Funneliformis geosporum TaxID=1117311 RepID=A0A9W4SFC1_9GLOM|nr:16707_t:CDS:2 [Funneliformis geosporum]CAI2166499.1 9900_t:CDS:2 [Funneliformis geosporum]